MPMLKRGTVLIVDDEKGMCHILKRLLSDEGYHVDTANCADDALVLIKQTSYDTAMFDIRMPGMSGLELLDQAKELSPDTAVIMMTAFGTIETAVNAMKQGAYDYISKPFNNDEIILIVANAMERKRLLDRNRYLSEILEEREGLHDMIGSSHAMQSLYKTIEKVASTDSTVLILGESGTGKELVARAIHKSSERKSGTFLAINCGALPRELIESELFGYEKGSFSGAHHRKIGLFESANGGTIFLDEIGDLPLELQVTLLRVLEQREIRRIGAVQSIPVDIRVLAATNQQLKRDIEEGTFREDLFYRLSVVDLHLPPLRERSEDIPMLIDYFIKRFNQKLNRSIEEITSEALKYVMDYSWPGNVRELENVIQRGMVLAEGRRIDETTLPQSLFEKKTHVKESASPLFDPNQLSFQKAREAFEHKYLEKLLKINDANVTKSALMAGISRRHLQDLMKKYNLRSS